MRPHLIAVASLSLCIASQCVMALPAAAQRGNLPRGDAAFGGGAFPAVGSVLPDVSAFDEQGKPFSTKSLRGSYTVLVFGCLT